MDINIFSQKKKNIPMYTVTFGLGKERLYRYPCKYKCLFKGD